jgi:hypothetical protein
MKIDSVKIIMGSKTKRGMNLQSQSEIIVNENKYSLIDNIGDGFQSTLSLNFSDQTNIEDNSIIEVNYEYYYDEKKPKKKLVLNTIRAITLFIVIGNFFLSYIMLGAVTFWF